MGGTIIAHTWVFGNSNGTRNSGSNYGNDLDVSAPWATWAIDENNAPYYFTGTSAAAPVIAGWLALYKSMIFVEWAAYVGDNLWGSRESAWNSQTGHGVPPLPVNALVDFGCVRYDFNENGTFDVQDVQLQAYRYASEYGSALYEAKYDLEPT